MPENGGEVDRKDDKQNKNDGAKEKFSKYVSQKILTGINVRTVMIYYQSVFGSA
jgi:hypothetical protein